MSAIVSALAIVAALGSSPRKGGGVYTEVDMDIMYSDRLGLVTRGSRFILEAGYLKGDFQGSYGFGSYWRFGAAMSWEPILLSGLRSSAQIAEQETLAIQFYSPQLCVSRGADLFKVGFWWKLRFGPVWSTTKQEVFYDSDVVWGGQLNGEIAATYNVGGWFKIGPRLGLGILVDEVRTAYQGTLGLALYFQLPLRRVKTDQPADYWEKDY